MKKIYIMQSGEEILLSFKYDRELVGIVRSLEKRYWDASYKLWAIPNTESARTELRGKFKGKVEFVKRKLKS